MDLGAPLTRSALTIAVASGLKPWDTEGNAILAGSLTEIPALGAAGLHQRRRTD